jgi:phage gp36-like protein
MFIDPSELKTHLYDEQVGEIIRGDAAIVPAAIDAAIIEMQGYLSGYDIAVIFNAVGTDRNALVLLFCKDIAVWHLITLCAPDAEYQLREERYKRAIQWLRDVQQRKNLPALPLVPNSTNATEGLLTWGGNKKRNNRLD